MNIRETPIELTTPADLDHGLTLVTAGGQPSHYTHEVSARYDNQQAWNYLTDADYKLRCGWVKDGVQFWSYWKRFDLTVGSW